MTLLNGVEFISFSPFVACHALFPWVRGKADEQLEGVNSTIQAIVLSVILSFSTVVLSVFLPSFLLSIRSKRPLVVI